MARPKIVAEGGNHRSENLILAGLTLVALGLITALICYAIRDVHRLELSRPSSTASHDDHP